MAKKNKKNKETLTAGSVISIAMKDAEKVGTRTYEFETPVGDNAIFQVKANEGKNPQGKKCIRKTYSLNDKRVTLQAAKMIFNQIGIANGEEIKPLAQTKASLDAAVNWQAKNGSLLVAPVEDKKEKDESKPGKIDGFKKKQLKLEVAKKEAKGALSNHFLKKELKPILKSLFADSKVTTFASLIPAVQEFMTVEQIKEAFPNHF